MSCRRPLTEIATALVAAAWAWGCPLAPGARACGPFYEPTPLVEGDRFLLAAPVTGFLIELDRIAPPGDKPAFHAVMPEKNQSPQAQTAEADLAELRAALTAAGLATDRRDRILGDYTAVRSAIRRFQDAMDAWREELNWASYNPKAARPAPPAAPRLSVPPGLPKEFDLYLRGAIAYHAGDAESARQAWRDLLQLPPAQRKYRTVWAVFMTGRSYVETIPPEAVIWLARVRKLPDEGFADSLGLAAASLGWQGRAELNRDDLVRAVELYLLQHAAGGRSAAASLRVCAAALLKHGGPALARAAAHPQCRAVITAHVLAARDPRWLASGTQPKQVAAWLEAVESADARDVRGADRFAWIAYRAGDFAAAGRWAIRAPADSPVARWIRAKLLLRDGKLDEAAAVLAGLVPDMPAHAEAAEGEGRDWRPYEPASGRRDAAGELAALKMARCQYVQALEILLVHNWLADAAYVAERVLTVGELIACVDRGVPENCAGFLRSLLARRLVRLGRWKEARKHFGPPDARQLDEYIAAIRAAHDSKQPAAARADSFWRAAVLAIKNGQELMGYTTAWPGKNEDGTFRPWPRAPRLADPNDHKLAPVTGDEQRRAAAHRPESRQWQYAYEAARHAWSACELMPDESDATAERLCRAGTWLKYRDPPAADRFYKALVRRCGRTALGQEADRLRWLPKIED